MTAVRVCPTHGRVLEEDDDDLVCPCGPHVVKRWRVVDTARRLAVAEASRSYTKGITEMRAKAVPREATETTRPRVVTLAGANFQGNRGARLQVRLRHDRKLERWRVYWLRIDAKGAKKAGYTADVGALEEGREAYAKALQAAGAGQWKEAPMHRHGRGVEIKPIPPA